MYEVSITCVKLHGMALPALLEKCVNGLTVNLIVTLSQIESPSVPLVSARRRTKTPAT